MQLWGSVKLYSCFMRVTGHAAWLLQTAVRVHVCWPDLAAICACHLKPATHHVCCCLILSLLLQDIAAGRVSLAVLETGTMETVTRSLLQHRWGNIAVAALVYGQL